MTEAVRELLNVSAPVSFSEESLSADGSLSIKGFVSVETKDRSDDKVSPNEFRVEQFMAAPTLLVNHKFWIDPQGNSVSVGRPTSLNIAKLVSLDDDDTNWGIFDLKRKEVVNKFPKEKIPNLRKGDRGLFVVANITQPEIVKMIRRGELNAFSWRGLVNVEYKLAKEGMVTERHFTNIDLFEISVVNMPDNPDATFIIGKNVDGGIWENWDVTGPLTLHIVRLDKSRFETKGLATEYLKLHNLSVSRVRDDGKYYYCMQKSREDFEVDKLSCLKLTEDVHLIVGPLKQIENRKITEKTTDKTDKPLSWFGELLNLGIATTCNQETIMAEETVKETKTDEAKGAEAPQEVSKEAQAMETLSSQIATKTSAGVVEGLRPVLETLGQSMSKMGDTFAQFVEKTTKATEKQEPEEKEEKTQEKQEAQKSLKEIWATLNELASGLSKNQDQLVEVAKTVQAVAVSTPAEIMREEKIISKSALNNGPNDPNSCFDKMFPFI